MAKQTGDIKITGTFNGLCCYKMYDGYFVRTKSSLTGKRFWKEKAFAGSRKSCNLLAKASPVASAFYKTYPVQMKKRGLFNEMTGRVKLWLKEGKTEEEASLLLEQHYPVHQKQTIKTKKSRKAKQAVVETRKEKLFTVSVYKKVRPYKRKRRYHLQE